MKTIIDREGRISLGQEVQANLGVQPGDEVLLENHGDGWTIKAAKSKAGLCREGNVLVHCGEQPLPSDDGLDGSREDRMSTLTEGLRQ